MANRRGKDGSNIESFTNVMSGYSYDKGILINSTPVVVGMAGCPLPCIVAVKPQSGDTVRVEYSLDDGSTWDMWPAGDVTTNNESRMTTCVTHLRFTRLSGSSQLSRWAVA